MNFNNMPILRAVEPQSAPRHDDYADAVRYALDKIMKEQDTSVLTFLERERRRAATSFIRMIERVIFNDPATIILWKDGSKTVVKCHAEKYDPEKGLAMALLKHILPGGAYHKVFKTWLPKEAESKNTEDITPSCKNCKHYRALNDNMNFATVLATCTRRPYRNTVYPGSICAYFEQKGELKQNE